MKKLLLIGLMMVCLPMLHAQESVTHENILKLKIGTGYQLDTYLSPMGYSGWQYGLGNEWWQPFRQDTRLGKAGKVAHWAHVGRVDMAVNNYYNSAYSNLILGFRINGGWGAFYEWRWIDDRLSVHAGPYLDVTFCVREHARNVNKVVSFDAAADVMAMGGVSWSFYGKKTSYRLSYQIRTNLIGFDYLPEYWESYYEITQGVSGMARCSGHWNHNTLKHQLSLDLQFPHSTWRVGAEHELLNYGTDNLHFMNNHMSIVVGCIWRYKIHANARL